MNGLQHIADIVTQNLPASAAIGAVVVEAILRLVPSEKPLSIAYGVASVMHLVGKICEGVGTFLDKVLPQKVK